MNPKYYPPLKPYAEAAREVLNVMPELSNTENNLPAGIASVVHRVLKQEYDSGDKPGLMHLEQEFLGLIPRIDSQRRLHQKVWFEAFKPFGWEVIDMQ